MEIHAATSTKFSQADSRKKIFLFNTVYHVHSSEYILLKLRIECMGAYTYNQYDVPARVLRVR